MADFRDSLVQPTYHQNILYRLRDFLGGLMSGITQTIIGQPFDTIKVRLQQEQGKLTVKECINELINKEGKFALYKGVIPPLALNGIAISLEFGVFETSKKLYAQIGGARLDQIPLIYSLWASITAGLALSFIFTPMELIRIKQQLCKTNEFKSVLYTIRAIIKENGGKGMFRGLTSTALRESFGEVFYFVTYDASMKYFRKNHPLKLDFVAPIFCGGLAGLMFWVGIYPIDTIKSRIQGDDLHNPKYKGLFDCLKKTVQENGYKSLYKGVGICALRSVPTNSGGFLAFEHTVKFCEEQLHKRH